MITGFVGTPGSGKSYEAVQKILDNIKLGRKIYTNIAGINSTKAKVAIAAYCNVTDYQLEVCLNYLDEEQVLNFWDHCATGSLILIDEVHKLFSNRDWASDKNKLFCEWASTHRHGVYDVVLITQDLEKIDKHARSLIEWTYFFRKVNFLGGAVQRSYLCYVYSGSEHTGKSIGKNKKRYDTKVFDCYQSYDVEGSVEQQFMKPVNILKHPVFYSIPVLLLIFGFILSKSSFVSGELYSPSVAVAASSPSVPASSVPASSGPVPSAPAPSVLITQQQSVDLTSVVKSYVLPDGKVIWTNNGIIPPGGRFLKFL